MIIITKQKLFFNLMLLIPIMLIVGGYSTLFGNDNKLVIIICISHGLMFFKNHLCYDKKTSAKIVLGLYLAIGISSIISQYSLLFGILFNFIMLATVIDLTTEDLDSSLYSIFLLFYIFMEGTPIVDGTISLRLISIVVCGLLAALICYYCTPKDATNPARQSHPKARLRQLKSSDPKRYYFILRMSLALTIGMALGHIIGFEKGMWINVTILSLTQLSYQETKARIPKRIVGTLIGIVLSVLIFNYLLPPQYTFIGFIVGGYCSSIVSGYLPKVSLYTMLAIASAMGLIGLGPAIFIRFGYMFLGILITITLTCLFYHKEQCLTKASSV